MRNNKVIVGLALLFILLGSGVLFNRFNYDEPTGGMDVNAGINENQEYLDYWLETDFIPNAKYTVGITLYC